MNVLRSAVVVGLVLASAACGSDGGSTEPATTPEPVTTVTEPPATEPPATEPPATEPPVTEPPATEPPVTEPPVTEPPATEPPATEPPAPLVDVRVYFLRGERLVVEHRDVVGPGVLRGALSELVAGPNAAERAAGLTSTIPAGTEVLGVDIDDGVATVDLSSVYESGGGSLSMFARVGQVVFTATQFPNVDSVRFWLDGAPIDYLGGEGLIMTEPWRRMDVPRDLTGAVIVDSPAPGDTVTSPFTVTGEGDVFEGQFPIEIWRDGVRIGVVAPVTAGAWGDWRDFETSITLDVDPGPIELVTFDAGGCGDDPECPPVIRTVVPLTLGG